MTDRYDDRHTITFRVSTDERQQIRDAAAAEGVTVQVFLERRALGEPHRTDRRFGPTGNPRRRQAQRELPLTG